MNSQSKYDAEAGIDENKNTRHGKIPIVQGDIAGHSARLLPDLPPRPRAAGAQCAWPVPRRA